MGTIIFIDTEVSEIDNKAHDFGAVSESGEKIHTGSQSEFLKFISDAEYLCGHNIIDHDLKYIGSHAGAKYIDTLYLSPILFPQKPYHALVKDDKLITEELNNPLNDSVKAMSLFYDEVNAFKELDKDLQRIYYMLLGNNRYFSAFFKYIGFDEQCSIKDTILSAFSDKICKNAPIKKFIKKYPTELAYCLALISAGDRHSLIPKWVMINFPETDMILRALRNTSCGKCGYCRSELDPKIFLEKYFGYKEFRSYNGEPLQEKAVRAAAEHRSLLAVFPTGGGKSLTFQIPALMAGEAERGLTVVISPLQSLMKDQVDNLEQKGIAEAVTINGLLNCVERAEAIERVASGMASILYISPESLRSVTIEKLFLSRKIERFVIDEAHCFSAWGQDFRVDYLYIGDFIRELQDQKGKGCRIPVSCFTATAKQRVISDIKEYFKNKLDIDLELFTSDASRTNLHYEVMLRNSDEEKYDALRYLLEQKICPAIVYVSRTKRTLQIAEKLTHDGFKALPFNGKMDSSEKQKNQEAFIENKVQIIVATSAFGMGVDKSDVGLVIHYDISDSLENYVQEAGRAGRDQSLNADCYILFSSGDLDKHFILLNQSKLSINEIQQIWKAVKDMTKVRQHICCSALEIARQAGWDDSVFDIETRVRTALQALENSGYVKRGKNMPRVYADSILVNNMSEAAERIDNSGRFISDKEKENAKRIIRSLISSKNISRAGNSDAESRIDYIADGLGIEKTDVIYAVQQMREEGILADAKDLTAYIYKTDTANRSLAALRKFKALETFLLENISEENICFNYKELNEAAIKSGVKTSSVNALKTLFYYWTIKDYIRKEQDASTNKIILTANISIDKIKERRFKSYDIAEFIIGYLFDRCKNIPDTNGEILVGFSVLELINGYKENFSAVINNNDIEEALLFLSKINALKLEGGFTVLYNRIELQRLILDNKIRYKAEDYKQLNEFYKQKIQQIHIVGEFADMMSRNYDDALQFVNDYFQMENKKFLSKYFSGERSAEIEKNITPEKYRQLFETLSPAQLKIINDNLSKYIVVSAGPGSGKTRILVHKLASLFLLEDVKHEQLLMLTFSRAAAIEFKQRLHDLIGNAAYFVEIKTFHSYCFDLLGKIGNIKDSENAVKDAVDLIRSGDIDPGRITKNVLVIDEAQDMDADEYELIEVLMERNEDMRVIAVGDDDQNIYQFRGSDPKYLDSLITDHGAVQYSLVENFRSSKNIVAFSNRFAKEIQYRIKHEDISAVSEKDGETALIKHIGRNFETAVVNDIISADVTGTSCVLTNTNQEALMILGILKQRGIPAKLIQSTDGFEIYNIAEIRYFLKRLDSEKTSPIISDEQWNTALSELKESYGKSSCLPVIIDILDTFDAVNDKKYRTDLEVYLHESKIEDFYKSDQETITVSTMHKAKGREFDNVFMMLKNVSVSTDEEKRKIYVGMTRAKNVLHIHYNGKIFDKFSDVCTSFRTDLNNYPEPPFIILQLSHKDVFLDFFKDKKSLILKMQSGMRLMIKGQRLYARVNNEFTPVLQFSAKCNSEIQKIISAGYVPVNSEIRFICAWKGKEDTEESAVILPDIYFKYRDTFE